MTTFPIFWGLECQQGLPQNAWRVSKGMETQNHDSKQDIYYFQAIHWLDGLIAVPLEPGGLPLDSMKIQCFSWKYSLKKNLPRIGLFP